MGRAWTGRTLRPTRIKRYPSDREAVGSHQEGATPARMKFWHGVVDHAAIPALADQISVILEAQGQAAIVEMLVIIDGTVDPELAAVMRDRMRRLRPVALSPVEKRLLTRRRAYWRKTHPEAT